MSKKRALVCLGLVAVLSGCETDPTPNSPIVGPTTKPAPTVAVAPTPANVSTPTPPSVPAWDAPVDGRPVFMKIRGQGVQIYQCKKDAAGLYAWKWVAPEALLYNEKGRNIGKHGAGPSWELSDGSKVIAEKIGEMPKDGTIPWLLMKTTSASGKGMLTSVKYIKRIDTDGGLPPTTPADAAHADKEERVPYQATYVLYAGT